MPQQPDAAPRVQTENPESGLALATKLAIELGPLLVFFGTNAAAEFMLRRRCSWPRRLLRSAWPGGAITKFR